MFKDLSKILKDKDLLRILQRSSKEIQRSLMERSFKDLS